MTEHTPVTTKSELPYLYSLGFETVEDYYYDSLRHSVVMKKDSTCVIVDYDLCLQNNDAVFDYSKYCEMQNGLMASSGRLFRFYAAEGEDLCESIHNWLTMEPDDIEISDKGGVFDKVHVDNTPLEKTFEDLFVETYGNDALGFLQKEYSLSLSNGRNAFVDYVVETSTGSYAIEENGVGYHHPQIIRLEAYKRQLEKQNTLSLMGFKTFRFSFENLRFRDQAIDSIRTYLGPRNAFRNAHFIKGTRPFALYTHQETFLQEMRDARERGINTSLVVEPTGTGKSQIAIEDIYRLYKEGKIERVLVMVPSVRIKADWEARLEPFRDRLDITIELYNRSYLRRNHTAEDYFDYLLFDEAQHAQAANCAKTLQYFTPKYLVGLTATPERLDRKKLEDIFGHYKTNLTLREAIDKDVITNIRCYRLLSNVDLSAVRYNGKDYNYADLEKTLIVDSRNELIVRTLKKYFYPREVPKVCHYGKPLLSNPNEGRP